MYYKAWWRVVGVADRTMTSVICQNLVDLHKSREYVNLGCVKSSAIVLLDMLIKCVNLCF